MLLDKVSLAPPLPGAREACTSRCASSGAAHGTAPPGAAGGDEYPDDMLADHPHDSAAAPADLSDEDSGVGILSDA